MGDQDLWRDQSIRSLDVQLHTARAGWRLRANNSVECPNHDARMEDRTGARVRKRLHSEASRADATDCAQNRRVAAGSSSPAGRGQYHRGLRRADRRRDRRASRHRQSRVYGFYRSRQTHPAGIHRKSEASVAGAGWQVTQHCFRRSDLEDAIPTSLFGFCMLSGQACSAGTRVFVQRDFHDRFVEHLTRYASNVTAGDPMDPATTIGPLVSKEQFNRVKATLMSAKTKAPKQLWAERRGPARAFLSIPRYSRA